MAGLRQLIGQIRTITRWLRPLGIPLHSAYTGFFLILSLFPSLLLLLGLLKYTSYGIEDLMLLLPEDSPTVVADYMVYPFSWGILAGVFGYIVSLAIMAVYRLLGFH